jgi:hypothetical protein
VFTAIILGTVAFALTLAIFLLAAVLTFRLMREKSLPLTERKLNRAAVVLLDLTALNLGFLWLCTMMVRQGLHRAIEQEIWGIAWFVSAFLFYFISVLCMIFLKNTKYRLLQGIAWLLPVLLYSFQMVCKDIRGFF